MIVDVYTKGAELRLGKALKKIEQAGVQTVDDMTRVGVEHARMLAPKYTGFIYRSIQRRTLKQSGGDTKGLVFIDPIITPKSERSKGDESGWKYPTGTFSLVRWMHQTRGKFHSGRMAGKQHIPVRNATFMYGTRDYLNKIKSGVAKGQYSKLNFR